MEQPSVIVCKYFILVAILCGTLQYTKKLKQYPRDLIDSIFGAQKIKNLSHSACDLTEIWHNQTLLSDVSCLILHSEGTLERNINFQKCLIIGARYLQE